METHGWVLSNRLLASAIWTAILSFVVEPTTVAASYLDYLTDDFLFSDDFSDNGYLSRDLGDSWL
jgi:hypothetical protein